MILAIDPGNEQSTWVIIDEETYKPLLFAKEANREVYEKVWRFANDGEKPKLVIEMVSHYGTGMPAGESVFDTCVWIGKFISQWEGVSEEEETVIKRQTIKAHLCGSTRAKDSNVIQALVDRFAKGQPNYGKGTKANPGWFYGFSADIWQAYALGVTYLDTRGDKTCTTL